MNIFETVAWGAPTLELVGFGALSALFLVSVSLNLWFLSRIRGLDARQHDLMKRIKERTERRDLAAVAVAAVVLTRGDQQASRKEIEHEVECLLQHWAHLEEMADDVSRKLDEVVSAGDPR